MMSRTGFYIITVTIIIVIFLKNQQNQTNSEDGAKHSETINNIIAGCLPVTATEHTNILDKVTEHIHQH
jgi:hypothetical protein